MSPGPVWERDFLYRPQAPECVRGGGQSEAPSCTVSRLNAVNFKLISSQGPPRCARASLRDIQCILLYFICWDSAKKKKKKNLVAGWKPPWCELKTRRLPSASRKAMAVSQPVCLERRRWRISRVTALALGDECFPSFPTSRVPHRRPVRHRRVHGWSQRGLLHTQLSAHTALRTRGSPLTAHAALCTRGSPLTRLSAHAAFRSLHTRLSAHAVLCTRSSPLTPLRLAASQSQGWILLPC